MPVKKTVKKTAKSRSIIPNPKKTEILVVELYPDRQAWEYHPWESADSYSAFCTYLKLGPTRTLSKVAYELLSPEKKAQIESDQQAFVEESSKAKKSSPRALKKSMTPQLLAPAGYLTEWCSKFLWVDRAAMWEGFLAERDRMMLLDQRADFTRRNVDLGKYLADLGKEWLEKLPTLNKIPSYTEALKMIELGNKTEKSGLGMDEETAQKINLSVQSNFNFENLSDKELDQFMELNGKVVSRGGKQVLTAHIPATPGYSSRPRTPPTPPQEAQDGK